MQSVYSSAEPFIPFNSGGGPAYAPVNWLLASTTNDAGLLTATSDFQNSTASSLEKGANSGDGLRIGTSMKPVAPYYDAFGLFDAAGSQVPGYYASWYGFSAYAGGIDFLRVGDASQSISAAVPDGAELRVEMWNDSVRYFVNDNEIYRTAGPAPAAHYVPGLILYRTGDSWRDGQLYAQNVTPR